LPILSAAKTSLDARDKTANGRFVAEYPAITAVWSCAAPIHAPGIKSSALINFLRAAKIAPAFLNAGMPTGVLEGST